MHDLVGAYALNALDDRERRSFERHLDTCAACRMEVGDLLQAAAALGGATEIPPSPDLKARVMAGIDATTPPASAAPAASWPRWVISLAAVVAVAFVAVSLFSGDGSSGPFEDLTQREGAIVASLDSTPAYVSDTEPDARLAYLPESGRAVLVFTDLAPISTDRTYEAWIITADGPSPAGLFRPDVRGSVELELDRAVPEGATIGVTVEPAQGSAQPTGDVLFVVEL